MADAVAPTLGDFFKGKGKKKIKASNLNNATTKVEVDPSKLKKDKDDDVWVEVQPERATMAVEVAGKLMREEDNKPEEDVSAPAWKIDKGGDKKENAVNEKRYPALQKSAGAVTLDDGEAKVNIQTSKNVFSALEGDDSDDEKGGKRPKQVNAAMVKKKQGESEKMALAREVEKYKKNPKKKGTKTGEDDEEDGEEEDAEADDADEAAATAEATAEDEGRKKKAAEKKKEKKPQEDEKEEKEEEELEEDLKLQPDLVASKEKYKGRKKLPPTDLPREELRPKQDDKPKQAAGKKKKMVFEEETEKKLAYAD